MPELSDATLEVLIRQSLGEEVAGLPANGWRGRVRDAAAERLAREARPHRMRGPLLLGIAAALLVPLGVLLAGSTPSPPPNASTELEAILVQGVEGPDGSELHVVAATAAGAERQVAIIPPSAYEWYWLNHPTEAAVSADGRLALRTGGKNEWYTLVFDLAEPAARAETYPFHSLAFDPLGRIWIPDPDGGINADDLPVRAFDIVDPMNDARTRVDLPAEVLAEALGPNGYGPFTLDGEAVLASDRYRAAGTWPDSWLVGTDGSLLRDAELAWQGVRWISPIHFELAVCGTGEDGHPNLCPDVGTVRAGPTRGDGTWYESADLPALDASWDAELGGLWVLRGSASRSSSTRGYALMHLDAPFAGFTEELDRATLSFTLPAGESFGPRILGLAPDDSIAVIGRQISDELVGSVAIVDTRTGDVSIHEGRLAGFVPADSIPASR